MRELVQSAVSQMGPMGGHMNQPDYTLIIIATASIVIIAFSVILLLFPRL